MKALSDINRATVLDEIDRVSKSCDYGKDCTRRELAKLPPGYLMVHSMYFINDYMNGGAAQTRHNNTWCLILDAISAAEYVGETKLARLLRELVFYFHRKGQSRLKRRIPENYFDDLPSSWDRSLDDLFREIAGNYRECQDKVDALPDTKPELFRSS